jgi:hypothetical protein
MFSLHFLQINTCQGNCVAVGASSNKCFRLLMTNAIKASRSFHPQKYHSYRIYS